MNEEILRRVLQLYNITENIDEKMTEIMPMTIANLGNSSIATIPILYKLFMQGDIDGHSYEKKGVYVFASVGAGMNINCIVYIHE